MISHLKIYLKKKFFFKISSFSLVELFRTEISFHLLYTGQKIQGDCTIYVPT